MASVVKLSADLFLNSARFEKGMKRAKSSFKKFQKTIKAGAKRVAAAMAVVSVAVIAIVKAQLSLIDQTAKLSRSLGINTREFQAQAMAAEEAGINQQKYGNIITKSQRSIIEASRGLETYKRSFDTLGLEVKELLKLTPDQQFLKIGQALEKIEDPTLRTATALEIFGKSGRDVINLLPDMAQKIDEARAFNDKFGISLSSLDTAKVEEANDRFGRVQMAIGGLGKQMAIYFAPILTHISEAFLQSGFDGEKMGQMITSAMNLVGKAIDIVNHAVLGLRLSFNAVVISIGDLVAKLSLVLYDLGVQIAKTLSLIPSVSLQAETALLDIGYAAKRMSDGSQETFDELIDKLHEYESTTTKISNIQNEANKRLSKNGNEQLELARANNLALGEQTIKINEAAEAEKARGKAKKEIDEAEKERQKELEKAEQKRLATNRELAKTIVGGFNDAVREGKKFSDVLKDVLSDIEAILYKSVVTDPLEDLLGGILNGGGKSGGAGGGGIANIFSSLLGGLPSFDVGTSRVPRDMIAQIHKDEIIVPAYDANRMRGGGGGGVNVIINNNAGANVQTSSRQTSDSTDLNVMIDQAVADNINNPTSRTSGALSSKQNRSLKRR